MDTTGNIEKHNTLRRLALLQEKRNTTYEKQAKKYGVNSWHLSELFHNPNYKPTSKIAKKLGLKIYVEVEACPTCGNGHCHNCGEQKVIRKKGSGRKRPPRVEIPLSDPVEARKKLEKALAKVHKN